MFMSDWLYKVNIEDGECILISKHDTHDGIYLGLPQELGSYVHLDYGLTLDQAECLVARLQQIIKEQRNGL